jgi:hypothetical protein
MVMVTMTMLSFVFVFVLYNGGLERAGFVLA